MKVRHKLIIPFLILFVFVGVYSGIALNSRRQKTPAQQKSEIIKLEYSNRDLKGDKYTPPAVSPIVVSADRLLVPVGDILYMLDSNDHIVWHYSFEPNIIEDLMVDSKGDIYLTVSDGLLLALNASGKDIWRTGTSGSANYSQIESYLDGLLVVVDMEGYRAKGSNSEDTLEFWKDRKIAWSKEFPRGAKLQVWGTKVLAVQEVKEGKEIKEIL